MTTPTQFRAGDQERLLSLWAGAPFGVAFLNADGQVTSSNDAIHAITGYDQAELAEIPLAAYTHPDDVADSAARFRALIAGESDSYRVEIRLVRKDGASVWVDAYVSSVQTEPNGPRRMMAMVQDLTSEREARREQVEALSRFEAIFENAPIGIGLISLRGRLEHTNAVMREITGFSAEELASRNVLDYTLPEDVAELSELFIGMIAGKHESYRHEMRLYSKDGNVVWVDSATALLRDADGKPQAAVSMAQNITERRAVEEQLRQSQKIEAIGQLSAGIAHDFNNLLFGILGYTELAQAEVGTTGRAAEYLQQIERSARGAATMTNQLLAFGRRQTLRPEPLALNDLVSETVSMVGRLLGGRIELVMALDTELKLVRADAGQMQQVLINLALNARDAMPDGGALTIRTRNVELPAEDHQSHELEPGPYVVLSVEDEGCGMTPEVRARVFDPFFTTKGPGKGTGLGLSSALGIVQQSGGQMEVTSVPGAGSGFHSYLPALTIGVVQRPSLEPPLAPRHGTRDAGERILVVDDEDVVRTMLGLALEKLGYSVETAVDATAALPTLRERGDEFALVISDMMMPHMTGIEFAREVGGWLPDLPFVFMSGYAEEVLAREGELATGTFLKKPFNSQTLATTVSGALVHAA